MCESVGLESIPRGRVKVPGNILATALETPWGEQRAKRAERGEFGGALTLRVPVGVLEGSRVGLPLPTLRPHDAPLCILQAAFLHKFKAQSWLV